MVKFDAQWALFGEKTHTDIERYTQTQINRQAKGPADTDTYTHTDIDTHTHTHSHTVTTLLFYSNTQRHTVIEGDQAAKHSVRLIHTLTQRQYHQSQTEIRSQTENA